jgi:predicted alpha/beta superfamily hydrolase
VVRVYTPPNYSTDQLYPVLYLHDGQNIFYDSTSFVGEWFVDEIMDSLYKSVGFECIVVAIDHMGVDRMREYNPWDNERFGKGLGKAYVDWIVEEVKPFIDRNFSTQSDPQYTAMMGASLGGTITHYAMLKYPGIFGKGGIYSPSYWISNKELWMMTSNYSSDQALKAVVLMGKEGWGNVRKAKKQAALLHKNDVITIQFIRDKKGRHNEKMWSKHFADTMLYLLQ